MIHPGPGEVLFQQQTDDALLRVHSAGDGAAVTIAPDHPEEVALGVIVRPARIREMCAALYEAVGIRDANLPAVATETERAEMAAAISAFFPRGEDAGSPASISWMAEQMLRSGYGRKS